MTESNNPPPPPGDPYDTAPASAPPPPPDAAMLNPNPTPPAEPIPYGTGTGGPTGYPGPYIGPAPDANAKQKGMLCHILSLAGIIVPFGNLIGPLIIWQVKKAEHPFIDDQGKESVNFQILISIALIVSALLICVVVGFFLLPIVGLAGLILGILGGVKANNGEAYRYPFNIRFIK
jgi:uncharacterized Tic20 family protein